MTIIDNKPLSLKKELQSQIQTAKFNITNTAEFNITNIDEGRIFEHQQTGQLVFVPQQTSVKLMTKCLMMALKSLTKELRNEKYHG